MPVTINGTTGIVGPDGSASTPSYQGTDSNTGIFFPAADTIAFAEGGTEVMRIDSSGNVGIGTSSPGLRLDVAGGDSSTFDQAISGGRSSNYALSLLFKNSYWNSGAFGAAAIRGLDSGSSGGILAFYTTTNGGGTTGVPTERARIDSVGNLLVGTTSQVGFNGGAGANINANGAFRNGVSGSGDSSAWQRSSTGNYLAFFYGALNSNPSNVGSINTNGTNTTYSTSSDYRLKEAVQPMTGALAKVAALKPVTYKWKANGSDGEGFIAHELQAVVPQCVTGEKDAVDAEGKPVYQGIDTSFLVATLTAAIKEQQAIIESLTTRIAALEAA